jgi:hypothetical protein
LAFFSVVTARQIEVWGNECSSTAEYNYSGNVQEDFRLSQEMALTFEEAERTVAAEAERPAACAAQPPRELRHTKWPTPCKFYFKEGSTHKQIFESVPEL